jgi:CRP-like cAMP-binding protein
LLTDLTRKLRIVHYAPGDTILGRGELPDRFYIITRGEVTVMRWEGSGQEIKLCTLSAGEYIGEIGPPHRAPPTTSARATTAVELLVLDRATLQTMIASSGAAAYALADDVSQRVRHSTG